MADREALAHLLRRATFGPTAEEVDAAVRVGYEAAVAALIEPRAPDAGAARTPPPPAVIDVRRRTQEQRREDIRTATEWWLGRMVAAEHQLVEKLVFFWHGHWATSVQKVRIAGLMLRQQDVFRRYGRGDFAVFAKAMLRDAALVVWLDGERNTRAAPNENLARELMELFTLGIGAYTEDDVKAGARALTGWTVDRVTGRAGFNPRRHDDSVASILGETARHDADAYVDVLMRQSAHAKFLADRLWFRFGSGGRAPAALADAYRPDRDVTAVLRALFFDPAFAGTAGQLVKQPVEWLVGALRQLRLRPADLPRVVLGGLDDLDQVPFRPPSVGGWPAGAAWLTTSSVQVRLRVGAALAAKAPSTVVDRLTAVPPARRPDALARLLVVDRWTDRTRGVLAQAAADPRQLISLGLASPEYTVC